MGSDGFEKVLIGTRGAMTLCSPSVTLMPFEYCLPFDDVEKLKDVKDWQDFVKETCGVSLTVYTACLPGAAVSKS